jgi:hypothetical protein
MTSHNFFKGENIYRANLVSRQYYTHLNQMVLISNRRDWQAGKKSHMRTEDYGRFMQARLIQIYQVFAEQNRATYAPNRCIVLNMLYRGNIMQVKAQVTNENAIIMKEFFKIRGALKLKDFRFFLTNY